MNDENRACTRCLGTGYCDEDDRCERCEGTGIEPASQPEEIEENKMTHDELSRRYIKQNYGLDVEIGQRVLVDGLPGSIVGFNGAYLRVLLDGWSYAVNCHPTWRVIICAERITDAH